MHSSNVGNGAHFDQQNSHGLSMNNQHKNLNSPTTAPSLNEKYGVGSSHVVGGGSGHQIGSYHNGGSNNSRAPQISLGSHHGPLSSLQSPNNNFGGETAKTFTTVKGFNQDHWRAKLSIMNLDLD
jgi:hypothetical protein